MKMGSLDFGALYLEVQARLHLASQYFGDGPVKAGDDFHRELRLHAAVVDEAIEGVDERQADARGFSRQLL